MISNPSTLQNVIQTRKCVPCRECAKPNRCVLRALQNYLNQKRKTSNQHSKHSICWGQPPQKISNPSLSDDKEQQSLNNVTMSSRSQSRSTRHQRSTSAIVNSPSSKVFLSTSSYMNTLAKRVRVSGPN